MNQESYLKNSKYLAWGRGKGGDGSFDHQIKIRFDGWGIRCGKNKKRAFGMLSVVMGEGLGGGGY